MKRIIGLLAAGLLLLPGSGTAALQRDIHAAMTAEEASSSESAHPAADEALAEEMDDLSDESLDEDENSKKTPASDEETDGDVPAQPAAESVSAKTGKGGADERSSDDAAAYGAMTAIAPVTLKDGDWVFIEGDERRGWFFDRSTMTRNKDGSISYWQLILYNDLGKAQFAEAMHDADYEKVAYTLQRRVLSPKENTIRTYEILAYDDVNMLITEGDRDGHAAEIRSNTMAERERDAVKKAARRI